MTIPHFVYSAIDGHFVWLYLTVMGAALNIFVLQGTFQLSGLCP